MHAYEGSPPRMRGKCRCYNHTRIVHGITPAYAGKTPITIQNGLLIWDHPRSCGENSQVDNSDGTVSGSPPRMRGKPYQIHVQFGGVGITPAHAGKTQALRRL